MCGARDWPEIRGRASSGLGPHTYDPTYTHTHTCTCAYTRAHTYSLLIRVLTRIFVLADARLARHHDTSLLLLSSLILVGAKARREAMLAAE